MADISWFQAFLSILSGVLVALLSGYVSQVRDDQRWMKEEVYRSLFNELLVSQEGDFPEDEEGNYWSVWEDYDAYQKHRVEDSLRDDLESYAEKLRELNGLELRIRDKEQIVDILPQGMAEREIGQITLVHDRVENDREPMNVSVKRGISLTNWIELFGHIVVASDGPDDLRTNLIEYSEERGLGHERNFRTWDDEYPNWPEKLWSALTHEEYGIGGDIERMTQLRRVIQSDATELRQKIENRMTQSLLRALLRKLN